MATVTEPSVLPTIELVESDGEPMDSPWHRDAMHLLIEQVRYRMQGCRDYFVGGNMFIYFNLEQARNRDFRGPDFFYVKGVRYEPFRLYYVVWDEGGKYPDVIIELLSPTTADEDLTTKKTIYERVFRTPDYFCYDPETQELKGWHLVDQVYQPLQPNERGWLWCGQLGLWLGTWTGLYQGQTDTWLRYYDEQGQVVPLFAEGEAQLADAAQQRADAARQQADAAQQQADAAQQQADAARQQAGAERKRAEAAEAELARLRALLAQPEGQAKQPGNGAE